MAAWKAHFDCMFAVIKMWYKNIVGRFFGLVTKHARDRQTGRQNYHSQSHANIDASHSNNNHSGTVSVCFTRESVL